jgi:hypothetical protein
MLSLLAQIEPIQNQAIPADLTDYNQATSGASFAYYFVFIWRSLMFVGGFIVIIYFIQGAFEWMSANGEAAKIATARNKMTGAITGFIILTGVFVIIQVAESLFGIKILSPEIPTATGIPATL